MSERFRLDQKGERARSRVNRCRQMEVGGVGLLTCTSADDARWIVHAAATADEGGTRADGGDPAPGGASQDGDDRKREDD